VQLEREPEGLMPLNRTLNCSKIRNTFAIRQVPWRSAIGDLVKHYYELQQ
jgi:dTDP-4-dehydrorhamnose reductase